MDSHLMTLTGRIHSHETFGTLDGPGVRYVLFLQGCNLRCAYCHNPDTWAFGGKEVTVEEVIADILRYKNFIRDGGVTFSGGEPLLQPEFVKALCDECRKAGLHTAIDTAGAIPLGQCRAAIDAADLILLDIKAIDPATCKALTGQDNALALKLLDYCEAQRKDVWISHVVVPGFTMDAAQLKALQDYVKRFACVKKVNLLPFHKMGMYKWERLGLTSPLANTQEACL